MRLGILLLFVILTSACVAPSTEKGADESARVNEENRSESPTVGPHDDFAERENQLLLIEQQIQFATKSGGMSPDNYNFIERELTRLALQGVDPERIALLRTDLSKIAVGGKGQQAQGSWTQQPQQRRGSLGLTNEEYDQLPDCTDGMLTVSPVDMEEIVSIEPIGSSNPPEHTLASSSTDTYIAVNTRETTKTVPLYAPGDIWIVDIVQEKGATSDPEDDVIRYALCKDVYGTMDHLKDLSGELQTLVDGNTCLSNGPKGYDFESCAVRVFKKVSAGTELGAVGRLQGNFNFGIWDLRYNNTFANPARQGERSLHSVCPFNYYAEPLRSELIASIDRADKDCGTVEYDILGTLQGEWFYGNATNFRGPSDWQNQLFLGHSNRFADVAVISVGGVISEPLKWHFIPKKSGYVNVDFGKVSDSKIYCYESDGKYSSYDKGPSGRILLQLVTGKTLKAEYQQGECSSSVAFNNPVVYER